MHNAESILVIILASVLTLFLLVAVAVLVAGLKLLRQARRIAAKAEAAVDSVGTAATILKDTSGPLALLKLLRNIIKHGNTKKAKRNE